METKDTAWLEPRGHRAKCGQETGETGQAKSPSLDDWCDLIFFFSTLNAIKSH